MENTKTTRRREKEDRNWATFDGCSQSPSTISTESLSYDYSFASIQESLDYFRLSLANMEGETQLPEKVCNISNNYSPFDSALLFMLDQQHFNVKYLERL
jgi:hypothetical protein